MQTQPGIKAGPTEAGLNLFDDRLGTIDGIIDNIHKTLLVIEERLYGSRPQGVDATSPTSMPSLESRLNATVSRLREVDNLAQRIWHG